MSVFSRILAGELPASFVYRDERCAAFMDIHPMSRGHVLVVPTQPVVTLSELDRPDREHLFDLAVRIGEAQRRALGSLAQHLLVNDGRAASQTVPHVHIHVIPRYGRDHLRTLSRIVWHIATLAIPRDISARQRADLDRLAQGIGKALASPAAPQS